MCKELPNPISERADYFLYIPFHIDLKGTNVEIDLYLITYCSSWIINDSVVFGSKYAGMSNNNS